MKECTICKVSKPLEEFDRKKTGTYSGFCKDCRKKKMKDHYNQNKDYYLRKSQRNRKGYISKFERYKRSLSCTDCGISFEKEPYLCDFHHVDETSKEGNVSSIKYSSFEMVMKEIDKCIPLCSNCHRRRHALLAKLDKAPEYESGEVVGSSPTQSAE